MRIVLSCYRCIGEDREVRIAKPFNTSGLYSFTCPHGHQNSVVLQQQLFEVLAETGVQALVDGYYRDAVSSFMASLERAYEFYIRNVLISREIEFSVIDATWKSVASQSERQLGMFVALYASENQKAAPLLDPKMVKFRNGVIHKGEIPTLQQAISFGQAVVDIVQPMLSLICERYSDSVSYLIDVHMLEGAKSAELHPMRQTMWYPMIYRMDYGETPVEIDIYKIVMGRRAVLEELGPDPDVIRLPNEG